MPEQQAKIGRSSMSERERELRSRLKQLLDRYGVLHGTLNPRERVCGKSNCRCAKGEKHSSLYVVGSEGGKPKQLFVPRSWEQRVRAWVQCDKEIRALLNEISAIHWQRVLDRES